MFRFNLIVGILLSISFASFGQEAQTSTENSILKNPFQRSTVGASYTSWTEYVDFENASGTDKGFANFYGNSIFYEKEIFYRKYTGFAFEGAFLFGQANIGGTQTQITYKDSYTKFLGIQGSARYLYRLNNRISFSAGPLLLVRQISINDLNGVTAKSGSTLNYGVIGGMGFRMGDHLEVRQSFGTLMFKAAAIWSLALGYKF